MHSVSLYVLILVLRRPLPGLIYYLSSYISTLTARGPLPVSHNQLLSSRCHLAHSSCRSALRPHAALCSQTSCAASRAAPHRTPRFLALRTLSLVRLVLIRVSCRAAADQTPRPTPCRTLDSHAAPCLLYARRHRARLSLDPAPRCLVSPREDFMISVFRTRAFVFVTVEPIIRIYIPCMSIESERQQPG